MTVLITLLFIACAIIAFILVKPVPNGKNWVKWDASKKVDYTARFLFSAKRKGLMVQNPTAYYVKEMDKFYLKDDSSLNYDLINVLTSMIRLHEH